jgi:mono/diheme cytochrome c family protein
MEDYMLRNLSLTMMAAALAAGVITASQYRMSVAHAADQSTAAKITLPIVKTSPVSGSQMYGSYCAPCHGVNGKGKGPVGVTLKSPPTDLTALSRNYGGKYPSSHVASVLEFGFGIPTHGAATMPAWGPVLGKMDRANPEQRMLRIYNLSQYVESMQAR